MRGVVFTVVALIVMGLGYWAYSENYKTQEAMREARALQREIGSSRETLSVLQAEWAYLNRPDRLRDLADLNFGRLQLLPITPEQFGDVMQVGYPPRELKIPTFDGAIDVIGVEDVQGLDGEQYP